LKKNLDFLVSRLPDLPLHALQLNHPPANHQKSAKKNNWIEYFPIRESNPGLSGAFCSLLSG
jgi:hypothetical protein